MGMAIGFVEPRARAKMHDVRGSATRAHGGRRVGGARTSLPLRLILSSLRRFLGLACGDGGRPGR